MNNQLPLTVEEIIGKIEAVKSETLKEHLSAFKALGIYFNTVEPYKVDPDLARHTSSMLHRCRTNFDTKIYRKALLEQIKEVLITANIIVGHIDAGTFLQREALRAVAQIGDELLLLSELIDTAKKDLA